MSVLLEQSKCTNITVVGASGKNMIPIIKRITGILYNADDWNSLQLEPSSVFLGSSS